MNEAQRRLAALAWVDGKLVPDLAHYLTYLTGRPTGSGEVTWDVFGCLYAEAGNYKCLVFGRTFLTRSEIRAVRKEIATMQLPRTPSFKMGKAQLGLRTMMTISRQRGLPLGMYVTGQFNPAQGGAPQAVGALWCSQLIPPALIADKLKLAVR